MSIFTPRFGFGTVAKKKDAVGIYWYAEKSVQAKFLITVSNAPLKTSLKKLAHVQAQRFFIEHSFREAKSECGMADYQVRRWGAWHRHMALVTLGTLFLLKQKIQGRKQWPMLSFNDLVTALSHLLPYR